MRKALRWLLALTVLIGTLSTAGAATAAQPETAPGTTSTDTDIKDRLLAIPGMSLIEEKPYTGYRFFVLKLHPADRPPAPVQGHVPAADHRAAQGRLPPDGLLHRRLQRLHEPGPP